MKEKIPYPIITQLQARHQNKESYFLGRRCTIDPTHWAIRDVETRRCIQCEELGNYDLPFQVHYCHFESKEISEWHKSVLSGLWRNTANMKKDYTKWR